MSRHKSSQRSQPFYGRGSRESRSGERSCNRNHTRGQRSYCSTDSESVVVVPAFHAPFKNQPAGVAVAIQVDGQDPVVESCILKNSDSYRAEVASVALGLTRCEDFSDVLLVGSKMIHDSTEFHLPTWRIKGWRNREGYPIAAIDAWQRINERIGSLNVTIISPDNRPLDNEQWLYGLAHEKAMKLYKKAASRSRAY